MFRFFSFKNRTREKVEVFRKCWSLQFDHRWRSIAFSKRKRAETDGNRRKHCI